MQRFTMFNNETTLNDDFFLIEYVFSSCSISFIEEMNPEISTNGCPFNVGRAQIRSSFPIPSSILLLGIFAQEMQLSMSMQRLSNETGRTETNKTIL